MTPDTPPASRFQLTIAWTDHDQHRGLTLAAAAGLLLAAGFAVAGLPPYDIHGPLHHLGVMMPTCGATRATRFAAQGHWATSWQYNPLGLVLVWGAAALLLRSVVGAVTGCWLNLCVRRSWLLVVVLAVAVVALEVNQQLDAALLMGP